MQAAEAVKREIKGISLIKRLKRRVSSKKSIDEMFKKGCK